MIVRTVEETLDRMHNAAANADIESYFDCFTDNGYFIGTDRTERWTIRPDFYNYTKPYFDQGIGWTYTPVSRHVTYLNGEPFASASTMTDLNATTNNSTMPPHPSLSTVVLFDEILSHERFGTTRNSGVMILQQQQQQQQQQDAPTTDSSEPRQYSWKIAQYHLTIPIPNQLADAVVQIIRNSD